MPILETPGDAGDPRPEFARQTVRLDCRRFVFEPHVEFRELIVGRALPESGGTLRIDASLE